MDKAVGVTLKLGYYYYSLVIICGILWLAKQIQCLNRGRDSLSHYQNTIKVVHDAV